MLGAALGGGFAAAAPLQPYAPLPAETALETELLELTNDARTREGLPALATDEALALAARHHALEMRDLGFFSHTSPTLENATLGQRVARAGGFVRVIGENLAWIQGEGVAERSVAGWLESPGHRANLLNPEFSHVGFGSARHDDGRTFVVQVLAYQPAPLLGAEVVSALQEATLTEVTLELSRPAEVALFYRHENRGESTPVTALDAGRHTLTADLPDVRAAGEALHLQLGVRAPQTPGSFIGQDDGWLGPEGWRASGSAPQDGARVLEVAQRAETRRVYEVRLTFGGALRGDLGGWWGDAFFVPTVQSTASGTALHTAIPADAGDAPTRTLLLGEPQGSGSYTLIYGFRVVAEGGAARLTPAPPETP